MSALDIPVRIDAELLRELGDFTGILWSNIALEPIICEAIRAYMQPPPADQAQAQQPAASDAGYQWKQVFLPEGTRLRARFGRAPYFATVQNAEIKCGEQSLSPSDFANLQGSGNRNAWKAIWLRFPGSGQWVLADTCRAQQNTAITQLFKQAPQAS
ncbi:hypothetical protein GTP45_24920 [Pseudoduganella sp. FT55W]|uniref:Uncharacterized protein n=1 Tax=Duganella rivi TaxID=2666083 RepID=A0A7X4GVT2_9BURK|nr:hypothetical protein [Duganella rivi]MYM70069.1 hypothetical protein [Duganella rivi]